MSEAYLPDIYVSFRDSFGDLAAAVDGVGVAADGSGPLNDRERRLVKLGIALGAGASGAVKSNVRRAPSAGSMTKGSPRPGSLDRMVEDNKGSSASVAVLPSAETVTLGSAKKSLRSMLRAWTMPGTSNVIPNQPAAIHPGNLFSPIVMSPYSIALVVYCHWPVVMLCLPVPVIFPF